MPFGLTNAPATFQRMMESALSGLQWTSCLIYLYDVIVFGKTFTESLQRLESILQRLRSASLKLKPTKCHLFQVSVKFLGHVLSKEGILPDQANTAKILAWEQPNDETDVRSFLGMRRRHIQNYSKVARFLINLTCKGQKFHWTSEPVNAQRPWSICSRSWWVWKLWRILITMAYSYWTLMPAIGAKLLRHWQRTASCPFTNITNTTCWAGGSMWGLITRPWGGYLA
jgi:hypothetical protein